MSRDKNIVQLLSVGKFFPNLARSKLDFVQRNDITVLMFEDILISLRKHCFFAFNLDVERVQ